MEKLKRYQIKTYFKKSGEYFTSIFFETEKEAIAFIEDDKIRQKNLLNYDLMDQMNDQEWLNLQAIEKRKLEYPSWDEITEALIDDKQGDSSKLERIIKIRKEIKGKYPKA